MTQKETELQLWITREELAATMIQLWQYKLSEAQQRSLTLATNLQESKGATNGTQSS